jgi:hypothetical protein
MTMMRRLGILAKMAEWYAVNSQPTSRSAAYGIHVSETPTSTRNPKNARLSRHLDQWGEEARPDAASGSSKRSCRLAQRGAMLHDVGTGRARPYPSPRCIGL